MEAWVCAVSASLLEWSSRFSRISTVIEAMECFRSSVTALATPCATPSCRLDVMRNATAVMTLAVSGVTFGCREWAKRILARVSSEMASPSSIQPSFASSFLASLTSFTVPFVALTMSDASSRVLLGVIRPTPLERVVFGGIFLCRIARFVGGGIVTRYGGVIYYFAG